MFYVLSLWKLSIFLVLVGIVIERSIDLPWVKTLYIFLHSESIKMYEILKQCLNTIPSSNQVVGSGM